MIFTELLIRTKAGDRQAQQGISELYKPLLVKEAMTDGQFDADLYQELCLLLLVYIQKFQV